MDHFHLLHTCGYLSVILLQSDVIQSVRHSCRDLHGVDKGGGTSRSDLTADIIHPMEAPGHPTQSALSETVTAWLNFLSEGRKDENPVEGYKERPLRVNLSCLRLHRERLRMWYAVETPAHVSPCVQWYSGHGRSPAVRVVGRGLGWGGQTPLTCAQAHVGAWAGRGGCGSCVPCGPPGWHSGWVRGWGGGVGRPPRSTEWGLTEVFSPHTTVLQIQWRKSIWHHLNQSTFTSVSGFYFILFFFFFKWMNSSLIPIFVLVLFALCSSPLSRLLSTGGPRL